MFALPLALVAGCDAGAQAGQAFAIGADGIHVRQIPIAVEGGPGRLIVAELPRDISLEVVPVEAATGLQDVLGKPGGRSCVGINGGFYDDGGAMGWVVHAGQEVAPLRPGGGSGVLLIDADGPRIVHRDAAGGSPREALQSIDRLVEDGRNLVGANARPDVDARSAVALRADGTVVFAVVFADRAITREWSGGVQLGAASSSSGLSLAAWAQLLALPVADGGLGARSALNLDGGYSTSLSIHVGSRDYQVLAHGATINALHACVR
jgi:hypothetical protein